MQQTIADKIKALRKSKGLTQKEMGSQMGISDRAVSKWENGLSKPSIHRLFQMAKLFDVSVDYFDEHGETGVPVTDEDAEGMESLTELYKIGRGPSSSHTIGPEKAACIFGEKNREADAFSVILYGSLAKTGKGHGTDVVLKKTFAPRACKVQFNYTDSSFNHPNTMELIAWKNGKETDRTTVTSIGGGSIVFDGAYAKRPPRVYPHSRFGDIAAECRATNKRLWEYVFEQEGEELITYLGEIWNAMKSSIREGLSADGILPGGLDVHKKAKLLFNTQHLDESAEIRETRLVCSYAYAVGEQNASGEKIVTAPTCGAAGVLPAVLYYYQCNHRFSDEQIIRALATAGLIGNVIKKNASISGAECGCQAEIGSACAMAAAALGELFGLDIEKIEYAAEISIEHHLGLTCDPICGLVQIPCIERNAVAAMRAINAVRLASFLWNTRKISFDNVVHTMKTTGLDMKSSYKETSEAGLSKIKIG